MEHSRHITENNVAACGSLLLEMGTLSRLTGLSPSKAPKTDSISSVNRDDKQNCKVCPR